MTLLPGLVSDSAATNDSKKGKVSLNKGFEVWEKIEVSLCYSQAAGPFPSNTFAQMLDFVTWKYK